MEIIYTALPYWEASRRLNGLDFDLTLVDKI